ncbi:hypothetical protein CWE13_07975 [Aliidiomarina shirensis]|uniref:Uncharacterized protein n=1 Tax=Aliidiomarina shirensis TaxID=1048642 RepID=A0A432WSP5_9GAMM|nr:hypothetical protein [Aliidiomarina shirensis]RUO36779.1 hypothetical protein CWE13_07975 [Aliidiomarina shirensis]
MNFVILLSLISMSSSFIQHRTSELANVQIGEPVIFIGAPISVESQKGSYGDLIYPRSSESIVLSEGPRALKITYYIDKLIYGDFIGDDIEFYGFESKSSWPDYLTDGYVYVFLVKLNDVHVAALTRKISYSGSDNGLDWMICGEDFSPYNENDSPLFVTEVGQDECESGVRIEDLREYFLNFDFSKSSIENMPTRLFMENL